jgi:hypothetical protein
MHVAKGGRRPPIAEEMHEFMDAFLAAEMETDRLLAEYWHLRRHNLLPEHVGVRRIGPWVSFVGPIEGWELDRISDKEDRLLKS